MPQAIIHLASSLRNTGEPAAAVELLEKHPSNTVAEKAVKKVNSGHPEALHYLVAPSEFHLAHRHQIRDSCK
ncbi:hypothetical protein ACQR35_08985 [Pseudarthrobacter sp. J1738]|uniref:hypothetical protein n=1 Tax=unclassified Pseudarthrobacter TaxID=2647000 RepID=UPI003D2BF23A